jgi:uncharacterized membrane protein
MVMAVMAWVIAIPLLGLVTGLRTFTPMAILCWFAYFGHLPINDDWTAWVPKLSTAIVFSVLAIGELIGDKLPQIPGRTSLGPMLGRLGFGGLAGAIVAAGLDGSVVEGVVLAMAGALIGTFGGYLIRRDVVQHLQCKDWYVALAEDAIAICCAIFAMGIVTG